jgi:hypothetical protein
VQSPFLLLLFFALQVHAGLWAGGLLSSAPRSRQASVNKKISNLLDMKKEAFNAESYMQQEAIVRGVVHLCPGDQPERCKNLRDHYKEINHRLFHQVEGAIEKEKAKETKDSRTKKAQIGASVAAASIGLAGLAGVGEGVDAPPVGLEAEVSDKDGDGNIEWGVSGSVGENAGPVVGRR